MGSEKYKGKDAIQNYMLKCSGYIKAYTEPNNTAYFFDVPTKDLDGALDRFSSFLQKPSLDIDCIKNQRDIVDLEFRLWLNDKIRQNQILIDLMRDGHPSKTFNCGHEVSLRGDAKTLKEKLNEFHTHYYTSVPMFISMKANLDLDWMQVNLL